jgi:hypothetical protein
MKTTGLFLIICTLVLASVTGSAKTVKETRNIGAFTKINAQSGIDVYFTQGNLHHIEIETDDEILQKVRTEIKGETLSIGWNSKNRKNIFEGFKGKNVLIKVYVTAPVLNEISASGGVDFYLGDLSCDDSFQIYLSGAADAHIDNLNVNGNTHIAVSGGADCTIKSLQAKSGDFSASGAGDMVIRRLNVSECLSVSASGGSDIELSGNANNVSITASGGTDIALNGNVDQVSAFASGGSKVKLNGNANTVSVSASGGADIDVRKLKYNQIESRASGGGDIHK